MTSLLVRLQASCDKMKVTGCVCSKLAIDLIKIAVNKIVLAIELLHTAENECPCIVYELPACVYGWGK